MSIFQTILDDLFYVRTKAATRPAKPLAPVAPVQTVLKDELLKFIREFIFPSECAYAPGHYGDLNFVISENVPGDDGGLTKWGIDQASHPKIDINSLTQAQALDIYEDEYAVASWAECSPIISTGALYDFPIFESSLAFFDCQEVCGLSVAWRCAQKALRIPVDGIPGRITRQAVESLEPGRLDFTAKMIDARRAYHRELAAHIGHDAQFLQGWLNRCDNLQAYLSKI